MVFYHFVAEQWGQLKQGGIGLWGKKIGKLTKVVLAFPLVILMRLLKPLVLIRLGGLRSERIGHFSTNTAMYLSRRQQNPLRSLDIFYHNPPISNYQMKKMWERRLLISPLAQWCDIGNRLVPGGRAHMIDEQVDGKDPYGLYAKIDIPVTFTQEEENYGQENLRKMGIPQGAPFVCFHARTSVYLQRQFPRYDFSYHDFRDADIATYVPAIKELMSRGYYAIRMGQFEDDPLPIADPRFIDYALKWRSDFMDIYLGAKCHFFVGSPCGLTSIPRLFKRHTAWVNFIPVMLVLSWEEKAFILPKKLWLTAEKRFLTFPEMLLPQYSKITFTDDFRRMGIEPVSNTEEEISDVALEIEERLSGRWEETKEDILLQKKFWSLFPIDNEYHGVIRAKVGTKFLRKNIGLFGTLVQSHQ